MSPLTTLGDRLVPTSAKLNLMLSSDAVDCTRGVGATSEVAEAAPWLTSRR